MKNNQDFDELARQKLQEQAFPFEEAHWLDAQRAINAAKADRRGGAAWYIAGALLLLIGTGVLYTTQVLHWGVGTNEIAVIGTEVVTETNEAVTTASNNSQNDEGETAMTVANAVPAAPIDPVRPTGASSANTNTAAANEQKNLEPSRTTPSVPASRAVQVSAAKREAKRSVPIDKKDRDVTLTVATTAATIAPENTAAHIATTLPTEPVNTATTPVDHAFADPEPDTSNGNTASNDADPIVLDPATSTNPVFGDPVDLDPALPRPTDPPITATTPSAIPSTPNDATAVTATDTQAPEVKSSIDVPEPIAQEPVLSTKDTLITAAPAIPAVPPLIDPRAPWEISLLAGGFGSMSTYAGGEGALWSQAIKRESTAGFGAELMHMGRNFGFGSGVHYGSYADVLSAQEINSTSFNIRNFWYLNPVNLTILVVGDTIIGGVFYQGTSVDTTILVIAAGTDTTSISTRIREAREALVRTSYVEIPLLFDAHLVQGRWSLGLRSGPTIGLLTGRSGSLPVPGSNDYSDVNDLAFQRTVFGWTARAYIRYRFNSAWSIGLEPTARGQFMNNFELDGFKRRSNAIGGMISLSYRLR